jgi:integrase
MSEKALTAALRRMGYSGYEMTWHGFRTIASTLLNEQGWHPDLIEPQLAHAERNEVRGAYNKAQRLQEQRAMNRRGDYLGKLKAIPLVTQQQIAENTPSLDGPAVAIVSTMG